MTLFSKFADFGAVVCFSSIPNPIEIPLPLLDVSVFEYNYYISHIALVVNVFSTFFELNLSHLIIKKKCKRREQV